MTSGNTATERGEQTCEGFSPRLPAEVSSNDPEVLRAALVREATERRRGECLAGMQAEVVQLAVDLLVQQPDIEGFFGALTKTMVEDGEGHACGVWLIDDGGERCDLWLAYVKDRLFTARERLVNPDGLCTESRFPCESLGDHLFGYEAGWRQTVEYGGSFLNFLHDTTRTHTAFTPENHRRLREVKTAYDPGNLFHRNHNIPPLG